MKTILSILSLILFSHLTIAQTTTIPDSNFEQILILLGFDSGALDGTVPTANIDTITSLNIASQSISNLTGIEDFTALTDLNCNSNQLTGLDLSQNTSLINILCSYNQINNLILPQNTTLTNLRCAQNQLTSIDVTQNSALSFFQCSHNNLTNLNVTQNSVLSFLDFGDNQLTNIDLTQNPALTELYCNQNQLSSLNITQNPALIGLYCYINQLTSLDVTQNHALSFLQCADNNLTHLDLTQNIALVNLTCRYNQLTSLTLTQNPALTNIDCNNNQITELDLSQNPALIGLYCYNNQLTSLNLKNGNNINFTYFNAIQNYNLYCIEVDDPIWSLTNWLSIDFQASYASNCLYGIIDPNIISGKVVKDDDCSLQGSEEDLAGIIVKTTPNIFYGITNSLGEYTIFTDVGNYNVEQILPRNNNNLLITPLCPTPNYYTVNFNSLAQDTTNLNFHNDVIACPLLTTDISSTRRRRCFENHTYVNYCNQGYADAINVKVYVKFPEYINLVSADYSYTIDTDSNYVFDIGTLAQGDCGTIHIIDSVACINGITGLTQCTKAWITPLNNCADSLDPNFGPWDKSSIKVLEGECIGDTIVRLVISNHGSGDMTSASEYRIYSDNQLVYTGSFQLTSGDSLVLEIPANGTTIRLEADQHPLHPGNSLPRTTIKGCGNGGSPLTLGLLNDSQMDDENVNIEIHCMEIIDSYDPNDKKVSPEGTTTNRYVKPGTQLDYIIRFQNTGSDTAYRVVIVDTLSADLDLSTIQWGVSSHSYTIDVSGKGRAVVTFTFNNINLPDSATDESGSQGFVKFKISPNTNLSNGIIIHNEVDIYFDFNLPIKTNDAWVTIFDTTIVGSPISVTEITTQVKEHQFFTLKVIPNPFTKKLYITLPNSNKLINPNVNIYNLLGEKMSIDYEKSYGTIKFNGEHLTPGVYFIELRDQNRIIGRAKVIKR